MDDQEEDVVVRKPRLELASGPATGTKWRWIFIKNNTNIFLCPDKLNILSRHTESC